MKKISIIMPVYNTEAYVGRAIESVLSQTYQDWELLIVNDGSTDNSYSICKEYASSDQRIRVFTKENGGQASAKNLALGEITGDFIAFLDSDDWMDQDALEFYNNNIEKYNADVVESGCRSVSSDGTIEEYIRKETIELDGEECIDRLIQNDEAVGPGVCSKLFRTDVVLPKRFPNVRSCDDFPFIFDICVDVKKYVHIYEPKWNYFHRIDSTLTMSLKRPDIGAVNAQEHICETLKRKGWQKYYLLAQRTLCSKQFYLLYQLSLFSDNENYKQQFEDVLKDLLLSYEDYMKNPTMGVNKYMLRCIKIMPKWFWLKVLKTRFK